MSSTEQFTAATRNQIESQLLFTTSLAEKMIESMEKVIDLNLHAAKATLEASTANVHKLLSAGGPQEFLSASTNNVQPSAEMALSYGRHLAGIASNAQIELAKATESQIAENSRKLVSLFDEFSKYAPTGSEQAVALMKSTIDNVNSGYAQLSKSTKMAVEAIETNLNAAAAQVQQATAKATRASKK